MRKITATLSIVCVLSSIGLLTAQQDSKKEVVQPAKSIHIVYPIKDLAVWSENGTKLDPSILVALLKSKVTPGQWDGKSSINPYPEKGVIIVNATQNEHDAIANILAEFRGK